jgi:hypothetical protein
MKAGGKALLIVFLFNFQNAPDQFGQKNQNRAGYEPQYRVKAYKPVKPEMRMPVDKKVGDDSEGADNIKQNPKFAFDCRSVEIVKFFFIFHSISKFMIKASGPYTFP